MATRTATIIMRMDTGDYQAGAQRMSSAQRQMIAETKAANAQLLQSSRQEQREAAGDARKYGGLLERRGSLMSGSDRETVSLKARGSSERAATLAEQTAGRQALLERLAARKMAAQQAVAIARTEETELTALARAGAEQRMAVSKTEGQTKAGGGHWYDAMGGKRIVKQELKYAAAMAVGAHSPEMGLAVMGLLSGGPAGLAAAGIATVSMLYGKAVESAKQLRDAQEQHTDRLREAAEWARHLYQAPTTRLGGSLRERADSLDKEVLAIEKARRKEQSERGLMDRFAEAMEKQWKMGGPTSREERHALEDQDKAAARREAAQRRQQAQLEDQIEGRRRLMDLDIAAHAAEVGLMEEGPAKRRAVLLAAQAAEGKRFNAETLETQRTMAIAGKSIPEVNVYTRQRNAEAAAVERRRLAERQGVLRQEEAETRKEHQAAVEAEIQATTEGYARERAVLRSKHDWERAEYDRAGRDKTELLRRQAAEEEALRRQQAEVNVQLIRQGSASAIDLRLMAHEITELEAFRERLSQQVQAQTKGPLTEANKRAIESASQAEESKRVGGVVAGEIERHRTPMQQYQQFKRDIEAAVHREDPVLKAEAERRKMTVRQLANEMEAQKALELAPEQKHGGRFTDAASHWREVQSQLSATENYPKETVAELKRIQASNEALRTELEKWRREGVLR